MSAEARRPAPPCEDHVDAVSCPDHLGPAKAPGGSNTPARQNAREERMTIVKHSIDAETAEKAVAAAAKKATELKLKMCIAVADESGDLKAFARMDGAPKLSIQISQDKAYTAASYDFIKDDPPLLHGITHTPRLIVFGGGFPIVVKGEMIGAIGLSGGHYTQDMECARAALGAIGADAS